MVGMEDVGPHQLQGPGPLAEVVADGVRYAGPLELLLLLHQRTVYVAGGVWVKSRCAVNILERQLRHTNVNIKTILVKKVLVLLLYSVNIQSASNSIHRYLY